MDEKVEIYNWYDIEFSTAIKKENGANEIEVLCI